MELPEPPTTEPEPDRRAVTRLSSVGPTLNDARRSGLGEVGDTVPVFGRCTGLTAILVADLGGSVCTRTSGATRGTDIGDAGGLSLDSPRGMVFDCARRVGLC